MSFDAFSFGPTTRVAFGADRTARLGKDVAGLVGDGAAVLLVADPGVAKAGLGERVEGVLKKAGCKVGLFTDVRSDPLGRQVDAAAEAARSLGAKAVVGLGGGSTLDTAKFAAAIATADQPADHYGLALNPLPPRGLAKICLPTTAGTGSETTRVSVFT